MIFWIGLIGLTQSFSHLTLGYNFGAYSGYTDIKLLQCPCAGQCSLPLCWWILTARIWQQHWLHFWTASLAFLASWFEIPTVSSGLSERQLLHATQGCMQHLSHQRFTVAKRAPCCTTCWGGTLSRCNKVLLCFVSLKIYTSPFFSADAFDNELIMQTLRLILQGKTVQIPVYDFVTHSRWATTSSLFLFCVIS